MSALPPEADIREAARFLRWIGKMALQRTIYSGGMPAFLMVTQTAICAAAAESTKVCDLDYFSF